MNYKAGLVALIVLGVAALLMVFLVLPNIKTNDDRVTQTAAAPAAGLTPEAVNSGAKGTRVEADAPVAGTKPSPGSAPATPGPAQTAGTAEPTLPEARLPEPGLPEPALPEPPLSETASIDPAAGWVLPGFDVLRVEPDGSTVIAGRAEPGTQLQIMSGDTVIATADVGSTGDFAAVLDEPLAAGDYQLSLRSVDEGGASRTSEEIATVSVPKDRSGELLAMVSKPGEASRIIATPEAETPAPSGTASTPAAAPPATPAGNPAADETAALATEAPVATPPAAIVVTAVEIEGRRIFVAGTAKPGSTVRIYADDTLIGEATADQGGRFVVEARVELSVGNHTIRADMLGGDGTTVAFRAAVPFQRPPGDQVAAVAGPADTVPALIALDGGRFDALRLEVTKAFGLLKGLFAQTATPAVEALAAARSATEFALSSLARFKPDDATETGVKDMAARSSASAAEALSVLQALPADPSAVSADLGRLDATIASALMPQAQASGSLSATAPGGSGKPQTVMQAPLQQSKASVIIRRGDTLWQISRRVYGAGVRYTTIYLANQDQIVDPDRIAPGQIFGVPVEALPDSQSQELHRKRLSEGNRG